jgi:hypothetical protein
MLTGTVAGWVLPHEFKPLARRMSAHNTPPTHPRGTTCNFSLSGILARDGVMIAQAGF